MTKKYVGADGCKGKWFTVILFDNGKYEVELFDDIFSLWRGCHDANPILLDVPIGLRERDEQERQCDIEARKFLRPKRSSSVFPAPCREALKDATYEEASKTNQRITGRRLTRQTWNIIFYIRKVDELLQENEKARSCIREVHPEICFWALAGGRAMEFSKKRTQGYLERIKVLKRAYPNTMKVVNYTEKKYFRKDVGRDDILDALVAAVTATFNKGRLESIPENPEKDNRDLPMEMVYHLSRA